MKRKINTLSVLAMFFFFGNILLAQNNELPKVEAESILTIAKDRIPSKIDLFKAAPEDVNPLPEGAVVLWGGPEDANGEFDGGLNDWTTSGIPELGIWTWEEDANVAEGGFAPAGPIDSPSAANGAVALNSDFYDNGGLGTAGLGMGPVPGVHNADLISPIIDLTANTNVALSFFSYYRNFDSEVSVSYTNDDGMSWSDPIIVHDEIENPSNAGATNREALIYLPGAGGTDQFRIRFNFNGEYYFWMIDDVAIIEAPRNDLKLNRFFYTPASFAQPEGHIDIDTFSFIVQLSNPGIDHQTNVVLGAQVRDNNMNIIWETETIIDTIHAGVIDSTFNITETFVPDMLGIGDYNLTYTITADSMDVWEVDNMDGDSFIVSEFLFATEDGDNGAESYFTPGGSPPWQIGNVYQTSSGFGDDTYIAESITFAGTTNATDPLEGKVVNVWLLEVDNSQDPFGAGMPGFVGNPGLNIIGFGVHTYTNEQGEDRVTVPLEDFNGADYVTLNENTEYLALIDYASSNTIFQAFNTKLDYWNRGFNFLAYNESTGNWFGGFTDGDNLVPTIRLQLGLLPNNTTDLLPESSINVQPNPVADQLTVNIDLDETTEAVVFLTDIAGKIINVKEFDNLSTESLKFDMSNMANGTYLIRLSTEAGARTVKFVVQK